MSVLDQFGHLAVEKGDEQRGNVGAVDIGVSHHDHFFIAQVFVPVVDSSARTQRLDEIGKLLILSQLVSAGRGDIEDFTPQRKNSLRRAVARLFGGAAGRVACPI